MQSSALDVIFIPQPSGNLSFSAPILSVAPRTSPCRHPFVESCAEELSDGTYVKRTHLFLSQEPDSVEEQARVCESLGSLRSEVSSLGVL